jgi:phosphoribosylanthranilate isomerase
MALKTFVLVNDITNLSDARYSAGMGVNVLGFRFEIADADGTKFSEISSWIAGVSFSGVFESDPAFIAAMNAKFELDFIQVSDISLLSGLDLGKSQVILNIMVNSIQDLEGLNETIQLNADQVTYFLIESHTDGLHDELMTTIANTIYAEKCIIGFGLNADTVVEMLDDMPKLGGICLKGGEEERPGFNNYDEVMDVLEALEEY